MTKFIRRTGGDDFRMPHQRAEDMDEVADSMGPGGICDECGHFACRHSRLQCRFHELDPKKYKPCPCRGMQWDGERYYMDPAHGPLRPANRGEVTP